MNIKSRNNFYNIIIMIIKINLLFIPICKSMYLNRLNVYTFRNGLLNTKFAI